MSKKTLTPDQYLAEMNQQLQQHKYYCRGMAFTAYPEGTTGFAMSGYSTTGPFGLTGIYSQVAHQISEQFDLEA